MSFGNFCVLVIGKRLSFYSPDLQLSTGLNEGDCLTKLLDITLHVSRMHFPGGTVLLRHSNGAYIVAEWRQVPALKFQGRLVLFLARFLDGKKFPAGE